MEKFTSLLNRFILVAEYNTLKFIKVYFSFKFLEKLEWESAFMKNCQSIKSEYRWTLDLIELVQKNKLSRVKYLI